MLRLALFACLAGAATTTLAEIKIDIPDVSKPVETNIRAFLSLSRYAERKDIPDETIGRLQRRIVADTSFDSSPE